MAVFCGGRRLGGPAPLSRAGGVRSGGTLRVLQRLAGGGAELTHEGALMAAFRKFADSNGRITKEGFVAALTHPGGGCAITREEAEAEFRLHEAGVRRRGLVRIYRHGMGRPSPAAAPGARGRGGGEDGCGGGCPLGYRASSCRGGGEGGC